MIAARSGRWDGSGWGLIVCVSLSLILRAVFFDQYARFLRPIGDEHFYWTRALDLLVLLENLGSPSHPGAIAALDHVIDRGWFLPGLSIILLPVRALALETEMARLYIGGINFFLYAFSVYAIDRVVGRRSSLLVAAISGLFPVCVAYSFFFWGQLIAGQLIVLLLLGLILIHRALERARPLHLPAVAIGLMLVAIVYVRANFILIVPTVFGILLAQHLLLFEPRTAIAKFAPVALIAAAVFIAGLAPWSATLSSRMGGFYLTTTSVDLNRIITFAPPAILDDIVGDQNRFLALHRHLSGEAKRDGVPYAEAIRSAKERFLATLSLEQYTEAVTRNFAGYFLAENNLFRRIEKTKYHKHKKNTRPQPWDSTLLDWMRPLNSLMWYALLSLSVAALCVPFSLPGTSWLLPASFKGFFWAICAHPFVSVTHGQYYIGMLPLLIFLVAVVSSQGWPKRLLFRDCTNPGDRIMYGAQALSTCLVIGTVGLLLLGGLGPLGP